MKKNILIKTIVMCIFVISISLCLNYSYASSISVAAGSTSLTVGSSTTLTIRGNDVIGKVSITSSNPGVISLSSSEEWLEGVVTVRATAQSEGSAYITISSVDTSSASTGEQVNVSTGVNITSKAIVVDTRSSNNYLSTLKVEGYNLSPEFNSNTTNYSLTVKSDVNEISLSAYPADLKATTVVNGNLDLVSGENNVTVTVTAENGYKRVYTITVTKEKNPEDIDVTVEDIIIGNAKLKGSFNPELLEYMCDDITADVDKLDISVKTKIPDLKYEITGNDELKQGINHIKIKIISRDGSESKEYKIIVYKTDEVLALQDVKEDTEVADIIDTSLLGKIKRHKVRTAVYGGGALLLIVVVILIIVNIKKIKTRKIKENDGWLNYEENNENDINMNNTDEKEVTDNYEIDTEKYNYDDNVEYNPSEDEKIDEEIRIRAGSILNNRKYEDNHIVSDNESDEDSLEEKKTVEKTDSGIKLDLSSLKNNENK